MAGNKDKEERLGDLLIRKKIITPKQLDQAVQCQVLFGGRLGTNLLELGFITEDTLRRLLVEKYRLPAVTREDLLEIPREIINLVPRELAELHKVVPVRLTGDSLDLALLDPWRESSLLAVAQKTTLKVRPQIALELDLVWALERYYGVKRDARYVNLDRWLDHQRERRKAPLRKKSPPAFVADSLFPDPQDITAREGVPRSLDDFWDRVGRSGHPEYLLPRVVKDLEQAASRDEIARILLDFASVIFKRAMLFTVQEDLLFGWDGRGEGIDCRLAAAIMIPLARRSMFKTVVETGAYFLGPVPESPINKRFLAALGPARPQGVLILPVMVAGKVAVLLYGDMGHDQPLTAQLPHLQTAVTAAAQAFQRLIFKQKAANPKPGEVEDQS